MSLTQEKALFHLSGKLDLSGLHADSLQQVAEEYPYFAPAQYFLASKLSIEKNERSISQAQKANLYFSNPFWLRYQLAHGLKNTHEPKTSALPFTTVPEGMAVPTVEAVKEIMRKIDRLEEVQKEDEEEPLPEGAETDSPIETDESDSKIAGMLSGQLAEFKKPLAADAKLDIEQEKQRLHTIDYFASQGIKIDLSSIPQDKLTRHLLKFTDWLKQIKQVNPAELSANLEMEKAVAETAKTSNETREVLTETMAEVLIKQGQVDKAIQLLIKLSFLNPEKSAYFAAKIEQLKGI
jgi:hypothetical protein